MDPKLTAAIDIFKELGWNEATADQAATLPLGSTEQQKTAREGLTKDEWTEVGVDRDMLALYAIRVGIPARHAIRLVPWNKKHVLPDVLATMDKPWLQEFIRRASEFRPWENAISVLGTTLVDLVTRLELPVPEHVDYLKDWGCVLAGHLTDYPVERLDEQITPKNALKARFQEHLTVATSIGTPVTGPLGVVPAGAVKEGWLTREEALAYAFTGIEFAVRPGDRKRWAQIITEDLQATDEELLAQAPGLIPVISTAEPAVIELLGVRILPQLQGDAWGEMALILSYAATAKALVGALQSMAKCPKPSGESVAMVAPRLGELTTHKNSKIAKLSQKLLDDWGQEATEPEQEDPSDLFVWNPYPGFQESPRLNLPEPATAETITPLLAYINDDDASSLRPEIFWAQLVQLCQSDVAGAKRLVAGLKNNSFLQAWSKGKQIPHPLFPETIMRHSLDPVQARNVYLLKSLGSKPIPCLLSQPSFEDMSIDLKDLLDRLKTYAATDGAEVMSADLLLALTRLRVPRVGVIEFQEQFRALNLPVEGTSRSVGEVVADYLEDPIIDPATYKGSSSSTRTELEFPASLKDFVDLEESRHHTWRTGCFGDVSIYPFFTESNMCCALIDADWRDRIARFGAPLPPRVIADFLTPEEPSTEHAGALTRAWERGLIVPGKWRYSLENLRHDVAGKAASLRIAAELGALAAVWPLLDFMLGHHAEKPRVAAGVAELADLAVELAPVVTKALADGVAKPEEAPITGLAALANKGGSSRAVRTAKKALEIFPKDLVAKNNKEESSAAGALLTEEEFARAWPVAKQEAHNPEDGFALSLAMIEHSSQEKLLQVTLSKGEEAYTLAYGGSTRELYGEGQTYGKGPDGTDVWLRWDQSEGRLVAARNHNWLKGADAPLWKASPNLLTDTLIAVLIAHMQDRPEITYPEYAVRETLTKNRISAAGMSAAVEKLLACPEFNPTRTFGLLEKHPEFLPVLWPLLTKCLAHAAKQEAPPRWTPRCLDAIGAYAQALATATAKGIIPAESWEPLRVLARAKKKSAAKAKAQDLVGVLLGG